MTEEYLIIEKYKSEFQKLLNQWKHQFEFEIIWMSMRTTKESLLDTVYYALIKRWVKCPHGTLGGWKSCMKCRPELMKGEMKDALKTLSDHADKQEHEDED